MVMDDKPLIKLKPNTTFEKLVWERQINKMLLEQLRKQDIKLEELENELKETKLKHIQEITELKKRMQKDNLGAVILKNKRLTEANHFKDLKLAEYKKQNSELFLLLAKANNSELFKDSIDQKS